MKKKILIALALVSVVALSIGGTVAFLTSKEADTNTFTMGNVEIDLISNLDNVTDPIKLMPNNTEKTNANYRITNTGDSDAYVWLTVKVPVALEDTGDLSANNIIHWNVPGAYWYPNNQTDKYYASATRDGYMTDATVLVEGLVPDEDTWLVSESFGEAKGLETIDGVQYNVYNIMYKGAIKPGETTNTGVSTFFLDERIDKVGDGYALIINGQAAQPIDFDFTKEAFIVEAHAIQANGFKTVEEAFAAYQKQWAE